MLETQLFWDGWVSREGRRAGAAEGRYPYREGGLPFSILYITVPSKIIQIKERSLSTMSIEQYLIATPCLSQDPQCLFSGEFSPNSFDCEWMDAYLSLNNEEPSPPQPNPVSPLLASQNTLAYLPGGDSPAQEQLLAGKAKNRSAFHNFQKHLITLIKKVTCIKKAELACLPFGGRAYDLWKLFLSLRTTSKRNLYIIFGIDQRENEENIRSAAEKLPQLSRMLSRYGLKEIEGAQGLLRSIVGKQTQSLRREQLEQLSKVKKFDEFERYFKSFVEEISEGGITRRMRKVRKEKLLLGGREEP